MVPRGEVALVVAVDCGARLECLVLFEIFESLFSHYCHSLFFVGLNLTKHAELTPNSNLVLLEGPDGDPHSGVLFQQVRRRFRFICFEIIYASVQKR